MCSNPKSKPNCQITGLNLLEVLSLTGFREKQKDVL